jgi:hypothetical protein
MKIRTFRHIGSVSTGTLRPEDIIPDLIDLLRDLRGSLPRRIAADWRELERFYNLDNCTPDQDQDAHDIEDHLAERLYDEINAILPPFLYCGSIEGDGADIGVWPDWCAIDAARQDGELPDRYDLPAGYSGLALDVNDHGNATLYYVHKNGSARELWSVV